MASIQPLSGNVLVKPSDGESVSAGGIIIPDSSKEKPSEGEVIAVAADATDEISIGDVVIYKKFGGTTITHGDDEYLIIPDGDILAKYVEADAI
jgi:chaperonin GroES